MERLRDRFGRHLRNLRISVTDRCNFRCQYCMPAEGLKWLPRADVLTFEEIERLARVLVGLGIEEIRLTGGEPTLRRGLPDLIRLLAPIPDLKSVSITTNGYLLKQLAGPLAEAGLTRINVSLDTLSREKFEQITRRDYFQKVLDGLHELEKYPTVHPIKVNAVAIRNFTEEEVLGFARLARRKPYVVRFIEYMPLDAEGNWDVGKVLPGAEIKRIIDAWMPLVKVEGIDLSSTAQVYRFADGTGELGFINPVSEPFCSTCNRIRLTADGFLRTCLFSVEETNLRDAIRAGCSDEVLAETIRRAAWLKEKKHKINEGEQFQRASRSMSQIGG